MRSGAACATAHHRKNYFVLRFFDLTEQQRATYLTSGRSAALDRVLNRNAAAAEKEALGNKARFLAAFAPFVRRAHVYVPEADLPPQRFSRSQRHVLSQAGQRHDGARHRAAQHRGHPGPRRVLCRLPRAQRLLLEAPIRQHPALEALSPGCVNSVRINAARDRSGRVRLIGACLKCGGRNAATDNFHSGGVAYPLELASGRVCGPGRNNTDLHDYTRHPASGAYLPGTVIPFWRRSRRAYLRPWTAVPAWLRRLGHRRHARRPGAHRGQLALAGRQHHSIRRSGQIPPAA